MKLDALSIRELEAALYESSPESRAELLLAMETDKRKGVQRLLERFKREEQERREKLEKAQRMIEEESKLWSRGYQWVGGVDEAGRGPLAGPVVAACVILPKGMILDGVDDSKKLTPQRREELFHLIMDKALAVGIGWVGPKRIDEINILNATFEAMYQAVESCEIKPDYLLLDAVHLKNCGIPQMSLVHGDARSQSIAAASIIAKVTRDREMLIWHEKYPEYGFNKHKAYGTAEHIRAIQEFGLSPIHRRSFCLKFLHSR